MSSGPRRVWTLVSAAPLVVLAGVLVYGYALRPRRAERGPGRGQSPAARAGGAGRPGLHTPAACHNI